jgi:hypothetical protein
MFSADDPYTGVDLDKCRVPETGTIEPWAQESITALNSYTEISPSGTGLHIIVQGQLPPGRRRKGQTEVYDSDPYFTMTGEHLEGTPCSIEERDSALQRFCAKYLGEEQAAVKRGKQKEAGSHPRYEELSAYEALADAELIQKAMQAKDGEKFRRLWEGDLSDYDGDVSRADSALCWHLAFWSEKNLEQMDRLFRRSGLCRDKWDEPHYANGHTYGEHTIARAIALVTEVYQSEEDFEELPSEVFFEGDEMAESKETGEVQSSSLSGHSRSSNLSWYTAEGLQKEDLPELQWTIPGPVVEGLTLLAGPPKIAKSWLALNACLAVSTGELAFGKMLVESGTVLYLALEDGPARLKSRLDWLVGLEEPWPRKLLISHNAQRVKEGLEQALERLLETFSDTRLIVIDTFAKVRPPIQRRQSLYQEEYAVGEALHSLALEHHVAILVLHHVNKRDTPDP